MSRFRQIVHQSIIISRMFCPPLSALALQRFPWLEGVAEGGGGSQHLASSFFTIEGPEQLSPRARQIYNDLQAAIKKQKGLF